MKVSRLWRILPGIFPLFFCPLVQAEILGAIPDRDPNQARLRISWRSDLWTTPLSNKISPLRLYDVSASTPLISGKKWQTSLWFDTEGLSSGRPDLVVGERRTLIGSDLRTQEYGLGFYRQGESDNWFSTTVAHASDSDEPFRNGRDIGPEVQSIYAFSPTGNFQWLLAANYSKNRGYLNGRPVPLIGVIYRPQPGLLLTMGLPFFRLQWEYDAIWKTNILITPAGASFELLQAADTILSYRYYGGVSTRSYLHENRAESDMRLMFQETYGAAGVHVKLSQSTFIELLVGASYDRSFYEGKQVYQPVGNRTTLPADFCGRIRFEVLL